MFRCHWPEVPTIFSMMSEGKVMDITKRLLGPIALPQIAGADFHAVEIDVDSFIRRLLLFETYILYSVRLKEIPLLVPYLGYEGIRELISAHALEIRCECIQFVEGQFRTPPCPRLTYQFHVVDAHDREKYVHDCLANVHASPNLQHHQIVKLKRLVVGAITRPDVQQMFRTSVAPAFESDLLQNPAIAAAAVRMDLKRTRQRDPSDFTFHVHKVGEDRYQVDTDLSHQANISSEDAHETVKRGLLAVAELNQRVAEMRAYRALSGFIDGDVSLFRAKLDFLASLASSEIQEGRFERVISIVGLPECRLEAGKRINIDKLMEVRASSEVREFRDWLATVDSASDAEIKDRIASLRVRLGSFVQSSPGKVIRFLVAQSPLLIPGIVGVAGGLALAAVDQFLVEKIVRRSGIAAFVNELYPSLFER
jgi:hypothetical protein